ncbi:MAG TPA: inorganic phosphate transporter [Gammaproteobacteria bacterium]
MELLLIAGAAFLAFSNGANDNFKGFATVWGSQTLTYRQALTLATVATVLGSLASLMLAESLVAQFAGRGLVPDDVAGNSAFVLSVGLGAAATVALATRIGLPISTTHALIGGLVGAGLAENGGSVNLANLTGTFLLPLLISPFVAATLGGVAYGLIRKRNREDDCACVVADSAATDWNSGCVAARQSVGPRLIVATDEQCDRLDAPAARVQVSKVLDRVHTLSAACICFARGVNDTPKLTALLVAAQAFDAKGSMLTVAATMAAGGLLFSRRVARTMSQRMVRMDHAQGLSANLISAGLIIFASNLGMPVSTTHITVGSIAGVGVGARSIDWKTANAVLLSWVATLPLAAFVAYAISQIV